MATAIQEQLNESGYKTSSLMHYSQECCDPCTRTLCGLEIPENETPNLSREVDCVMCLELVKLNPVCPNCNSVCVL